ncbi:tyrosine recombinase XerC [Limosilactobacillus caecicola]|uniref:tyrosine recombinase XerC n=1 Tax=Limosilactobacillus caecicola TaxID=2941332 RepID=UPI00203BA6B7|nr:tyrosine recombinase XerC [Limosilactobacillus caecicola]
MVVNNPFDLAGVFAIYLSAERQLSAATVTAYENDLKMVRQFLNQHHRWSGWLKLGQLDIQAYLTHLNDLHRQWTTVNRELASLRTFYNFLLTNGLVKQNPFEEIKMKSHVRNLPRYFYEPEMNALFKAADGEGKPLDFRNRALLELLYATGMRVSECADLTLTQIDWDTQMILVRGKGDKERYVPFGQYAKDALQKYLNKCREPIMAKYHTQHERVFINHYGKPITSEGIEYVLNQVVKKSSLNMHIHPHMLRHTFATAMLNNGADIRSVQELLGHSSLSTTQIYTHVTRENLQKTYMKLFPRAKAEHDNQE